MSISNILRKTDNQKLPSFLLLSEMVNPDTEEVIDRLKKDTVRGSMLHPYTFSQLMDNASLDEFSLIKVRRYLLKGQEKHPNLYDGRLSQEYGVNIEYIDGLID